MSVASAALRHSATAPIDSAIASARSSSLLTATSPTLFAACACRIVHAMHGFPATSRVFFPGTPLLPARAKITAMAAC